MLDRIIQACLGLEVDTVVDRAEAVPGESVTLRHRVSVRSRVPVRWTALRHAGGHDALGTAVELRRDQPARRLVCGWWAGGRRLRLGGQRLGGVRAGVRLQLGQDLLDNRTHHAAQFIGVAHTSSPHHMLYYLKQQNTCN